MMTQHRSDVVWTLCVGEHTSSSVLHRLHLPQQVHQHTTQQRVAPVQVTCDKSLNNGLSSVSSLAGDSSPVSEQPHITVSVRVLHPGLQC